MTWVRADEAATALGVSIVNVRVIAHRDGWRRIRLGRQVAYHLDDVADSDARRHAHGQVLDKRVTSEADGGALHPSGPEA